LLCICTPHEFSSYYLHITNKLRWTRCPPIVSILDDILLHCQSSPTLEAAHTLLQTLTSNPKFSGAHENSAAALNGLLEDMGFSGLWRSCSFNLASTEQQDRTCFALTEKLIEVSFFYLLPWLILFFFFLFVEEGGRLTNSRVPYSLPY
jgi:neurofibromin 1